MQDEGNLFNSVYTWLNHDQEVRAQFAQQLSEHIRFPLLGVRKLLDMLKDEANSYFHEHIYKALVDFGQLAEPLARSRWERRDLYQRITVRGELRNVPAIGQTTKSRRTEERLSAVLR
ncbi:hypothetical protein AHF37_12259 [Paragonimus kellicotti]|nr:hypothetical protein AHF37_12259 [Paragonimus kellicotti]